MYLITVAGNRTKGNLWGTQNWCEDVEAIGVCCIVGSWNGLPVPGGGGGHKNNW